MAIAYLTIPKLSRKAVRRFWSKVDIGGQDECWNWTAYRKKDRGYGYVGIGRKVYIAHRVAYFLAHPEFRHNLNVLHSCDAPSCCNPAHLFEGTQFDNMRDMIQKGRMKHATGNANGSRLYPERLLRGERHHLAKLTSEKVREIRKLYSTGMYRLVDLGHLYGVAFSSIALVVKRKTWKHVK